MSSFPREIVGPGGLVQVNGCGLVATGPEQCATCGSPALCPWYFKATLCSPGTCWTPQTVYVCCDGGCYDNSIATWVRPVADLVRQGPVEVRRDGGPDLRSEAWVALGDAGVENLGSADPAVQAEMDRTTVVLHPGAHLEVGLADPGVRVTPTGGHLLWRARVFNRVQGGGGPEITAWVSWKLKQHGVWVNPPPPGFPPPAIGVRGNGAEAFGFVDLGGAAHSSDGDFSGLSFEFFGLAQAPPGYPPSAPIGADQGVELSMATAEIPGFRMFRDGEVISAEGKCWRVETGTRFYAGAVPPGAPAGSEVLPQGAAVLGGDIVCRFNAEGGVADCVAICPPLDGYYSGILCGCSKRPPNVDLQVWIRCSCVVAARLQNPGTGVGGGTACPVFPAVLPDGTPVCVFPNLTVPPTAAIEGGVIAGCAAVVGGCCACCPTCAGAEFTPFVTRFVNFTATTTYGQPARCCCRPAGATKIVSGEVKGYANFAPCRDQILYWRRWSGTVRTDAAGNVVSTVVERVTEYECGSGTIVSDSSATVNVPGPCGPGGLGGLPIRDGVQTVTCLSDVTVGTNVGEEGGFRFSVQETVTVQPGAGPCVEGGGCGGHAPGGFGVQATGAWVGGCGGCDGGEGL